MEDSTSSEEWHLHVAIADASLDHREAPWYGPRNIVLRDFIFRSFCPRPFLTITYPQFPVSKHVDIDDADDDDEEFEFGTDYYGDNDDNGMQMSQSPPTLRSSAPSPEMIRGSRSRLLATPPRIPASPPSSRQKIRTTRIPDFVQQLYRVKINNNGTISPIQFDSRIILLVEIKKNIRNPTMVHFAKIMEQTDHQSRHAFFTSQSKRLGVILAIGPFWRYVEYYREDLRPSPSLSEKKDTTYENTPTPPPALLAHEYQPFQELTGDAGFLCLETEESGQGLLVVRTRLQQLHLPAVSYFLVSPALSLNATVSHNVLSCYDYPLTRTG